MTNKYNSGDVDASAAGKILLEVVQTLRAFRSAGQHQGRHAISGTKVGVLHCLTRDDARLSDIARQLSISVSVASRAVDSLEHEGLVQRRGDSADGRAFLISLTEQGQADLSQRYRYVAERFASVLTDWTPEEATQVISTLQTLNTHLDQLTDVLTADERETFNQ